MPKKERHEEKSGGGGGGYACRPHAGQTYLTIGQDFFSIENYVLEQYSASLNRGSTLPLSHFHPAAAMVYTDIQKLRGLDQPVDYGSGIEYATGLFEAFGGGEDHSTKSTSSNKNFGLQIGLWLNGTQGCQDIVSGALQENVDRFLHYLVQEIPDTVKIFLRVGYEFDNPYFGYSQDPNLYRLAYRALVDRCEELYGPWSCRQKIAFCWHSWGAPRWIDNLMDFYPGDSYVDWVGVSIFQQVYPWAVVRGAGGDFAGGTMAYVRELLDLAESLKKPILIAESTPFGGMYLHDQDPSLLAAYNLMTTTPSGSNSTANANTTTSYSVVDIWNLWFQPTLDLIEEYDIGMWSYIDCNWNAQRMWKGVGFGDTRLATSGQVMDQWWDNVLSNPRFVHVMECSDDKDQQPTSMGHSSFKTVHKNKNHKKDESDNEYDYQYDSKNRDRIQTVDVYSYDSKKNHGNPVHFHYDSRYDEPIQKDSKNHDQPIQKVEEYYYDSKKNNGKPVHYHYDSRYDEPIQGESGSHYDSKNHGNPFHYHYDSIFDEQESLVPPWLLSSSMTRTTTTTPQVSNDGDGDVTQDHGHYEYDYHYDSHDEPIQEEYEYSYDSKKHHGKPFHYHYHQYGSTYDQQENLSFPDHTFTQGPMMIPAMMLILLGAILITLVLVRRGRSSSQRVEQRLNVLDESCPILNKETTSTNMDTDNKAHSSRKVETFFGSNSSTYGAL